MVERLGLTMSQAEEANPCFKRAVLKGHIVLSAQSSLQDVVCRGTCICCAMPHAATIADVLEQPVHGGKRIARAV